MIARIDARDRDQNTLRGLGGWLLVLCGLLLFWGPVSAALITSNALAALPIRGPAVAVLIAVRVVVAAVGIAGGIALTTRRAAAVALAKTALVLSAAADLVVYVTPYFPSNRMPGDTPIYVTASLAYHAIWFAYLVRSKRVRNTYG